VTGREPHRERLGEVLVGVLLPVPAGQVAHEALRERSRTVVVAVLGVEVAEHLAPLGLVVELVGVVHGVAGFVTEAGHDARRVLEVVRVLLFVGMETSVHQIERQTNEGDAVRTAPLVGDVTRRTEEDALLLQLGVELLDEGPQGTARELQPHLIDALTPEFGAGRLDQVAHGEDVARGSGSAQADGRSKIAELTDSEWRFCHDYAQNDGNSSRIQS
jgi:hypothetical protein